MRHPFRTLCLHEGSRGFTLFEVLVAIAVVALLAGISALSFNSMRQRYNVEKQIKEMYTDLMGARMSALQRNRDHFVTLSSSTTYYRVYADGPLPDGDGVFSAATDSLVSVGSLLPNYSMSWSQPTVTVVTFTSKGLVASSQAGIVRITPTAQGEYDCIVIDQIKTGMGAWDGSQCIVK